MKTECKNYGPYYFILTIMLLFVAGSIVMMGIGGAWLHTNESAFGVLIAGIVLFFLCAFAACICGGFIACIRDCEDY